MSPLPVHHPDHTYPHLSDGPELRLVQVDDQFWSTIDERTDLSTGRLVTSFEMSSDWDTWEMHPAGDELIMVTSGAARFHVDDGTSTSVVTVEAPRYIVVPSGSWHTADALGVARLVVITWGEGTAHRPRS